MSAWQFIKEGGVIGSPASSCFTPEDVNEINYYIEIIRNERQKDTNLFIDPVNTKLYKDYLDFVQVPIDITMI